MTGYIAILPLSALVLSLGLGLFTLSRNPRKAANIGFALGMLCIAVLEAGEAMILLSGQSPRIAEFGLRFSLAGRSVLPAAWLTFAISFSRKNPREAFSANAAIIGLACAGALFFLASSGSGSFASLPEERAVASGFFEKEEIVFMTVGSTGRYFYIYMIIVLVAALAHLESTFRSTSGAERWRIKYIVLGVSSILAFFIYLASKALLFSGLTLESIPLTSSVVIISGAMMGVFIVKHRLLDVDIFVSRYVVYRSLTFLLTGLYLVSTALIVYGIRYFEAPFTHFFTSLFVFISVLALFVVLFASSLRRKAALFINRNFYKHKYEFRDKWMETIERISPKRTVEETCATLKEMISGTMGARSVYLWLRDPATGAFRPAPGSPAGQKTFTADHPVLRRIEERGAPFLIDGPSRDERRSLNGPEDGLPPGTALCSPLSSGGELMGFVLLGEDLSGERYREDDFEFLTAVTTQAAVQIKNIRLATELLEARELEAFHTMSSFIMHDLKNLTNSLSLMSRNARTNIGNPEFQKDAIRTIDGMADRMRALIGKLSNVPRGLDLRREPLDLDAVIREALKKLPMDPAKGVVVEYRASTTLPVSVDREAMDMVFLNILKNAYEAVGAGGRITVAASAVNGCVSVTVSDNGRGMTKEFIESSLFKPFRTTRSGGLGIGLFQCKSVVEAHGGTIEAVSDPGKRSTFTVCIPCHAPEASR